MEDLRPGSPQAARGLHRQQARSNLYPGAFTWCGGRRVSTGTELVSRLWHHSLWIPAAVMAVITFAYRFMAFEGLSNDHYLHPARAARCVTRRCVLAHLEPSRDRGTCVSDSCRRLLCLRSCCVMTTASSWAWAARWQCSSGMARAAGGRR